MITRDQLLTFVREQPFRPFRIRMVSGRTYDIRHPEMIVVRSSVALVFFSVSPDDKAFDIWETVSLMLIESVSFLDTSVAERPG